MELERPYGRLFCEARGEGPDIFLCSPCYPITHSEIWKYNRPFLERSFRVITHDVIGNGRSTHTAAGLDFESQYADVCAVLEALARPPITLVALSCGSMLAVRYAVEHPDRVSRLVMISPQYSQPLPPTFEQRMAPDIATNTDAYVKRFFTSMYPEPHSLKGIEDGIEWASGTTGEILVESLRQLEKKNVHALLGEVRVPTLVLHGTADRIVPYKVGAEIAQRIPGASMVTFDKGGHGLTGREMFKVNSLISAFARGVPVETQRFAPTIERRVRDDLERGKPRKRARSGPPKVLFLSSPIGLGHVQRDIAFAQALRRRFPGLVVDFLTADPAARVVERAGERLHPGSRILQNESAHFESYAQDHELHAFDAMWTMDTVMANNFMVFAEAAERGDYDLWIGDEGWDLDYYLHENPEFKAAPYVFLTDFIGLVPMDESDSLEMKRTWEKNAENIDHLHHHPDVRDLSLMIGDAEDVLDRPFGKDLPNMRQWAREQFRFIGYTHHFDPATIPTRAELRRELGYRDDERVVLVSVGGTRVGRKLIDRCARAFALIADRFPDARLEIVGGPRLQPSELPAAPRTTVHAFVPDLYRAHSAVDLALVQGGLSTTMELAALGTPFLYFPLKDHFEQQHFVAGRLSRLGAGVRMDYDAATPEVIAAQIATSLERRGRPAPVGTDPAGVERAAALIADLLA
jgi:pimeloyl-ACP methyl ester carboxylesterase/UDP:flavonoid glycosyltransferase YjiC (YdhE family)